MTIMKYLGRKYDLAPVTEGEHQRVDLIEAEAIDMRGAWGRTCYNPDFVIVSEFRQPRQLLRGMSNPTGKSARWFRQEFHREVQTAVGFPRQSQVCSRRKGLIWTTQRTGRRLFLKKKNLSFIFQLTYVDFVLYEILDVHLIMEPKALEGLDNLVAYHQRIASLEKVAAYIKSDKFIASPLNGPMANFGGK